MSVPVTINPFRIVLPVDKAYFNTASVRRAVHDFGSVFHSKFLLAPLFAVGLLLVIKQLGSREPRNDSVQCWVLKRTQTGIAEKKVTFRRNQHSLSTLASAMLNSGVFGRTDKHFGRNIGARRRMKTWRCVNSHISSNESH